MATKPNKTMNTVDRLRLRMEKVCRDIGLPLESRTLILDWMDQERELLPEGLQAEDMDFKLPRGPRSSDQVKPRDSRLFESTTYLWSGDRQNVYLQSRGMGPGDGGGRLLP